MVVPPKGAIFMHEQTLPRCTDCGLFSCRDRDKAYPGFCTTTNETTPEELEELDRLYGSDTLDGRMARTAAQIEGRYYCQKTRVEETVLFIKQMGFQKVGIASCLGLVEEARTFAKILKHNGIDYVSVVCKVGGQDKSEMGIAEEDKICRGGPETMCNPVLQARILNRAHTDLNILIGLCVGHDALFTRHSDAPVTTLVAKDRVLGNNPCAALYSGYYKRLYQD